MTARTCHGEVGYAIQIDVQHLVDVAGNHIPDSVLLRRLVQRELAISKYDSYQPGWPVGNDELHGLRRVRLQISFEECQLVRGKLLRPAIIQNGEVRLFVVEAVMRRML